MSWSPEELSAWVHDIEAGGKDELVDLQVLGIRAVHSEDQLAHAFHALAREAHPDRWRGQFGATGMARVVKAYSRATLAYARLREKFVAERRPRARVSTAAESLGRSGTATVPPRATGIDAIRRERGISQPPVGLARAASPELAPEVRAERASRYHEAAKAALARADFGAALLNSRLAVAANPTSAELRDELAKTESLIRQL